MTAADPGESWPARASRPVRWHLAAAENELADRAWALLRRSVGRSPDGVWSAPGRVNLIGEHVDYNGGLCLPYALPYVTVVAARARDDRLVRCVSSVAAKSWSGALDDLRPGAVQGWAAYVAGALWSLERDGVDLPGLDLAIVTSVPVGAGLSSSAALICAVVIAAADLARTGDLSTGQAGPARLARIAIRAETDFVGAPTGGMDQTAALRAEPGHALLLDCLDGSAEALPLDPASEGLALLVIDTRAEHRNRSSEYGRRRRQCEEAARILGVETLRSVKELPAALRSLPTDVLRRRVRHVVTEIERVRRAADLLRRGTHRGLGALLDASHASLRDDFEVSAPELDVAVAAALDAGALGARLVGGGFGGSALALVEAPTRHPVAVAVDGAFQRADLRRPRMLLATAAAPAHRLR